MFIMDLASYLHMTVQTLLRTTTSAELTRWMLHFRRKTLVGEDRADYRNAMLGYTIASVFSGKGHKPQFTDFIPFYKKIMPTVTGLIAKLQAWAKPKKGGK